MHTNYSIRPKAKGEICVKLNKLECIVLIGRLGKGGVRQNEIS